MRTKVRLTGGTTLSQGRVEVFHNGQWGSICCGGFTSYSAQVICKQLGFIGFVCIKMMTIGNKREAIGTRGTF